MASFFNPGDVVFAQLRGHPKWPAKVIRPPTGKKGNNSLYYVFFFATHDYGYVPAGSVTNYMENKLKHELQYKRDDFKNAMTEANAFIQEKLAKKAAEITACYVKLQRIDAKRMELLKCGKSSGSHANGGSEYKEQRSVNNCSPPLHHSHRPEHGNPTSGDQNLTAKHGNPTSGDQNLTAKHQNSTSGHHNPTPGYRNIMPRHHNRVSGRRNRVSRRRRRASRRHNRPSFLQSLKGALTPEERTEQIRKRMRIKLVLKKQAKKSKKPPDA